MESTTSFEFCPSSSEKKCMHLWTSFGVCVPLVLLLKASVRRVDSNPLSRILGIPFKLLTPFITLIGTAALCYEESFDMGSFLNCGPFLPVDFTLYALARWTTLIVHGFFLVRTVVISAALSQVEVVCAIINIALSAQDLMAILTHQHLVAFRFLFLYNFFCPEVKVFFSKLLNIVSSKHTSLLMIVGRLCLVTLLLAGSLRVAEEWHTNENFHDGLDEPLTQMRSSWSYVYWTIVTISTVGYGDMTPSTPTGQLVLVVTIVIFLVWFGNITSDLYDHLEESSTQPSKDVTNSCLVIGCKTNQQLLQCKKLFPGESGQNVMVYVDAENADLSDEIDSLGFNVVRAANPVEAVTTTFHPGQPQDVVYILSDPTVDTDESDRLCNSLAKAIRNVGFMTHLLVDIAREREGVSQSASK